MNIYVVVSIDTECDQGISWKNFPLPLRFHGITQIIPHMLQKVFRKSGVKPTYLLSPEVIQDKTCVSVLKSLNNVELGTHLHAEFIEPQRKDWGEYTSDYQAMYPREIEEAKLRNLTQLFISKFGYSPKSFRAGRWGIGSNTFKILENLGYLVDSSVTPYFSWQFKDHFLDYKQALDVPYFTSAESILKPGSQRLLQVPVTIVSQYGHLVNHYINDGLLKDMLLKVPLWRPRWLRPTYSNFNQMKSIVDRYIAYHKADKHVVLNMMFHNVEIIPGENPYNFNQQRIEQFTNDLSQILEYLKTKDVQFIGLSELHPIFESNRIS